MPSCPGVCCIDVLDEVRFWKYQEDAFQASVVIASSGIDFLVNGYGLITLLPDNSNSSPLIIQKTSAPGRMGVFLFQEATEGKGFRTGHMVTQRQLPSSCPGWKIKPSSPAQLLLPASCVALDRLLCISELSLIF